MHRPDLLNALSTGWIEGALGVSRAAVANWRRGKFPERRREQLIEAVRDVLTDDESAPPEWARRVLAGVMALETKGQITDEELDAAEARAMIYLAASTRKRPRPGGGDGGGATGA